MAVQLSIHLPDELRGYAQEVAVALQAPLQANWDAEQTYTTAHQPMAIAALLIEHLPAHEHLQGASIGYLFREKMKTRDRVVLGKASKADAKLNFFGDFDLVIEFNWEAYRRLARLAGMQRIALVDHELSHFGREEDGKGDRKFVMISHDIEEFGGIVRRWGLWKPDLVVFAGAVVHAHQLGLFEGSPD